MSPESLKILYRLITCFQSSGRIGKSLVFEIILAWARFAGIPIAAVDCDAEHRTLSKKFPEAAFVDATRSNDEFLQLIMELPDTPMAIADFPAQATDFLLGAMASLRVLDALDARQTRMTVVMFAADDPTATASLAKTYRALGDRVDYLLIKNPARFRSYAFDESALAELFKKNRVPILELPTVTSTTIQAIEQASAERKKTSDLCRSHENTVHPADLPLRDRVFPESDAHPMRGRRPHARAGASDDQKPRLPSHRQNDPSPN
jgi:hypothetical protein